MRVDDGSELSNRRISTNESSALRCRPRRLATIKFVGVKPDAGLVAMLIGVVLVAIVLFVMNQGTPGNF
jgi:hypothetical protein